MPFQYSTFKSLTGGIHIQTSSVDVLRALVDTSPAKMGNRAAHARKVLDALADIPVVKIKKYEKGLIYLIENYSPLIPEVAPGANHPKKQGKRIQFTEEITGEKLERGDLLYGIGTDSGRAHPKYMGALLAGPRYADVYNNAFGIGTGAAFGKKGQGWGDAPTAQSVLENIGKVDLIPDDRPGQQEAHYAAAPLKRAYIDGLMKSRFAPTTVNNLSERELARNNNLRMGASSQEDINTATWNKAIRRACKYGLEMIATDPVFTTRKAEVHFVLDGLGDLSNMAFKKTMDEAVGRAQRSDYVPITSSEICFVFRNWEKMDRVVRFWVNGQEVQAPWLSHWVEVDVNNKPVTSAWEAWRRYALKRKVIKGKG